MSASDFYPFKINSHCVLGMTAHIIYSDMDEQNVCTFSKKIINHLILNPFQTYYWHKYNQIEYSNEEFHLSEEAKKYFYFKVLYSLIFYIILLIGFIKIKNDKKNYKFHLLLIFLVCYLVFMLGWVGNSRYFVPSLIFLSIFFGHGIDYIKELRYKKI